MQFPTDCSIHGGWMGLGQGNDQAFLIKISFIIVLLKIIRIIEKIIRILIENYFNKFRLDMPHPSSHSKTFFSDIFTLE